jgi:transposase
MQEKRIAELERLFARRSEKSVRTSVMPPITRPSRTQKQAAELRTSRAIEREAKMEVVNTTLAVSESEKHCTHCGDTTFRAFGDGKASEVVHYIQGYFRKHVIKRETCVCKCGERILTAEAPERWSNKTQYASSFVAYLVTQKCVASMPIYRLETMFSHLGIPIARSTMNELLHRAAAKLAPLRAVLFQALRKDFLIHVDETPLKMTTQKKKCLMWTFVGEKLTGYAFELSRSGTVPTVHLKNSKGAFVSDDYSGYNALEARKKRIRCGCLAHARRGFFEAGDVPEAKEALGLIQEIYGVEHEAARLQIVATAEHLALRTSDARPLFVKLMLLSRRILQEHGPKTLLGRAARYAFTNIRTLKRFLQDTRIPLDNNRAENALRVIALGRKNFLFVQSKESGEALALLYSLTTSCIQMDISPIDYLIDVLDRIEGTKVKNLRELLPDRWTPANAPDS